MSSDAARECVCPAESRVTQLLYISYVRSVLAVRAGGRPLCTTNATTFPASSIGYAVWPESTVQRSSARLGVFVRGAGGCLTVRIFFTIMQMEIEQRQSASMRVQRFIWTVGRGGGWTVDRPADRAVAVFRCGKLQAMIIICVWVEWLVELVGRAVVTRWKSGDGLSVRVCAVHWMYVDRLVSVYFQIIYKFVDCG